jgi:hypothetical protein
MPATHQRLFTEYVEELRRSKEFAEQWWLTLNQKSSDQAAIQSRWPDGPVSHPRVVAVIQKYYRGCETMNRIQNANLTPNVFLEEWLMEPETEDLSDFLAGLSYWPIGLNENNEVN